MKQNRYILILLSIALLFSESLIAANKYWVGNGGNWGDASHWSYQSGGNGGAGTPNEFEKAIFDANSFSTDNQTVIISGNISIGGMNWENITKNTSISSSENITLTSFGGIFLSEKITNDFKGRIEYIIGNNPSISNHYKKDFQGQVNYSFQPNNPIVIKTEKNAGAEVMAVVVTVTVTDETCPGNNDGTAKVNVAGSAGPFTYSYFPIGPYSGEPTDSIYNLVSKAYTVVVKDLSTGLNYPKNFNISSNPPITIIPAGTIDNTCFQSCDGQINLLTFGGLGTLHYLWSDGQTTESAINLCAGIYSLTITDDAGCTETHADTIIEPALLAGSISSQTNILCNGKCTGAATISVAGGTSGYTYSWYDAGGGATNSISNKCAGSYHCEITDTHGCLDTVTIDITQPAAIVLSASTAQNLLCNNVCIGRITYSGSGGTAPLNYSWYDAPGAPTTSPVFNVCAGTYNVEITDGNGCKDTATTTVTEPAALTSSITDSTNVMCRGLCTGDATVTAGGGVMPYTYFWYNLVGMTAVKATGICAGASNVQVTDANGCKDTSTVTITQPASTLFSNIVNQTNNICSNYCNGDATVRAMGGIGPYTFSWYDTPGLETDTVASNLCTQDYHVKVTDANGCKDTVTASILSPAPLTVDIVDSVPLNCLGTCIGELEALGSGGTAGYTYNWLTPAGPVTTRVTGLCAGTYSVEVQDANGCLDTVDYDLIVPPGVSIAITSSTNNNCFGQCLGQATAAGSNGTLPYTYNWYDAAGQSTASVSNLCNGTYNVEVTDGTGCRDTATTVITSPTQLIIDTTGFKNATCLGVCDGAVGVTSSGGTPGYSYLWYDFFNVTFTSINNLCVRNYSVEVTDLLGCKDTVVIAFVAPTVVDATVNTSDSTTCFGSCDGSANVHTVGGATPYSYDWTTAGNQTDSTAINLCGGNHSVTVTDANGCIDFASVTILEPQVLSVSITDSNNISCNGLSDGDATANASGGTAPYTYSWYDIAGTPTTAFVNGLGVGLYHVEATDAHGCTDTISVNITQPAVLNASISATNASCNGTCNGILNAAVSTGGTIPYSYVWYDAGNQTTASISSLCIGTYNVEVTDANGCIDSIAGTINEPTVLVAAMLDSNQATCPGICDGDATADASGGTAPYTYNWYTASNQNTALAINLCVGINEVQVTDSKGCKDTIQVHITSPVVVVATMIDSSVTSCTNICNGSAEVSAAGGTGPYTYNWFNDGNQTTAIATALCFGNRGVEVTDANGCLDTATVFIDISNNPVVAIITDSTATLCFNSCDGTANTSVSGGTGPYTYNWYTAGNQTDSTAINLCPGLSYVEITDAIGCIDTAQVLINSPTAVDGTVSITNPNCNGDCSGTASVLPFGGTPGVYTHSWSVGGTLSSVINLCAGVVADTITDAVGCKDTLLITITDPVILQANPTSKAVTCFGDTDGEVYSSPSGGTGSYTFLWDDVGSSTNDTVIGLTAGVYQVIVNDSLGCADTSSVSVLSPTALSLSIIDTVYTVCVCNGSATVGVAGGTSPYTYLWNDLGAQTTPQASNLCVGLYQVVVTDSSFCMDSISIAILDTSSIFIAKTVDSTDVSCFSICDGSAKALGMFGNPPYTYLWNDPLVQTDSIAINLCAGTYIAQVTDSTGCIRITHATVLGPPLISGTISVVEPLCNGDCNGNASIVPSGGNGAPYTHSWDIISTNDSILNICVGTYNDTITDVAGCSNVIPVIVSQPAILITVPTYTNISCNGANDGTAKANASGGTLPYTYLWDDPSATTIDSLINLAPGIYRVTVTDFNGCSYTDSVTITEPAVLTSFISDSSNVHCDCVGFANLSVSGGTTPYTFSWNDPGAQTDSLAVNLCAGYYTGTVTDSNGCISSSLVSIVDTSGFSAFISSQTDLVCNKICIGSATISASGGKLPYSYIWNDPASQTDSIAVNLCAGNYTGSVIDSAGCSYFMPITIHEPDSIDIQVTIQNVSCTGFCDGQLIFLASGGTGLTYTYQWNDPLLQNTATADSLCPGSYTIIVTDSVGCINSRTKSITEPLQLHAFIQSYNDVQCNGLCNGNINSLGVGGTTPYNYSWSNLANTKNINGLCPDTFQVNITDANGCVDSISQIITEPTPFSIAIVDSTNLLCGAVCDGMATVRANGGTLPYSYDWYNAGNQTDTTGINLCGGLNPVKVTDGNGCRDTAQVNLFAPPSLDITVTNEKDITCFNACNGTATVNASGGVSPYTITWNDPAATADTIVANLCPGTYTATVVDANGCIDSVQIIITEPTALAATISDTTHIFCAGNCVGTATVSVSGGTTPYSYLWPNAGNQTDSTATGLCDQFFTYAITDANGCNITDSIEILNKGMDTNLVQNNITCFGLCNGNAQIIPIGGQAPITHSWTTGSTISAISSLCQGTYTDTIRDGSGCVSILDVVITQPAPLIGVISDSSNISCNGSCDGVATVEPTGGTGPFTYSWYDTPGLETDTTASNLCPQTYHVKIVDVNGCKDTASVSLTEPTPIIVALLTKTNAKCFGECNAQARVIASGGTGLLTYNWNGGQTGDTVSTLCAGNDTVTVTDANGCPASLAVPIGQPNALQVTITDTIHILCANICNGQARAVASGGNGGYTYLWDDAGAQTTDLATALCAGPYNAQVTDSKGCISSMPVTINTLNALAVTINSKKPKCFGDCNGEVTAVGTGGVKPYSVTWGGPGNANNATTNKVLGLCQGNYFVTMTDQTGCVVNAAKQLNNPPLLIPTISDSTDLLCNGVCNGSATVSPQGGTPPFTYLWDDSNNQTTDIASNLCAGKYTIIVTDTNGCVKSNSVTLSEPTAITASNTTTPAQCTNTNEGTIDETAAGGTGALIFSWSGPNSYSSANLDNSNLYPGQYILTITDANNCTLLDTADVATLTFIDADAGNDSTICFGQSIALHGHGGLNYLWSTGDTDSNITISPVSDSKYTLYVTSANCTDSASIFITVNPLPTAIVSADKTFVLQGNSTTLHGTGAGIGGTYDWTPPTSLDDPTLQNPVATPPLSTTYILTVTNSAGCSDTTSILIKTAKEITFPNGITPNGDGRNEKWVIDLIEEFPQCNVEIYNRWGQLVFRSPGYVTQWDGNFDSKPLPVGTYYYVIDLGPGLNKYTGPITLMR